MDAIGVDLLSKESMSMKVVIATALLMVAVTVQAGMGAASRLRASILQQQYFGKKIVWRATDGYSHKGIVEDVIVPIWEDASADGLQLKVMRIDHNAEPVGHETIEAYRIVEGSEWLDKRVHFKGKNGVNYAGTVDNIRTGGILRPSDNGYKPSDKGIFYKEEITSLVVRDLVTDDPNMEVREWVFVDNMDTTSPFGQPVIEGEAIHPTQQIGRLFKFRNPHEPAEQLIGRVLVIHTSDWYEFEVVAVQKDGEHARELYDQRYILLISKEQLTEAVPYREL